MTPNRKPLQDYIEEPSPFAMFAAMIGAVGVAVAVILVITNGLERLARLERLAQVAQADARARLVVGNCEEPRKNGDRAVIIVRREGAKLAVECNPLLDWREPLRSLKK